MSMLGGMLTDVPAPFPLPIGLRLTQSARAVERAFDEALEQAGGTLPVWLILLNLKIHHPDNQRELAEAVGVREATLTHHLNSMDARGLITRRRDADNRRIHVVELTEDGQALFVRLQEAAIAFDTQLRDGLSETDIDTLNGLLDQLAVNAGGAFDETSLPWVRPGRDPQPPMPRAELSRAISPGWPATRPGPAASARPGTRPSPPPVRGWPGEPGRSRWQAPPGPAPTSAGTARAGSLAAPAP